MSRRLRFLLSIILATSLSFAYFCNAFAIKGGGNSGIVIITSDSFNKTATTVKLSKFVDAVEDGAFSDFKSLKSIEVDPDNPYFSSFDGCLYDKDFTTLICVPRNSISVKIKPSIISCYTHALDGLSDSRRSYVEDIVIANNRKSSDTILASSSNTNSNASSGSITSANATVKEFGEKHPEAEEYVRNFDQYAGKIYNPDVSGDLKEGEIPLFIQWDKRWGYGWYGSNYIGVAGCGPTCLSMVVCGLKNDATANPYEVSKYAEIKNYYVAGQGTSWTLMTTGALNYGLKYTTGQISAAYILNNLSPQSPMICSMKPGDFTSQGHFIVLTGVTPDGKIIINDPVSPANSAKAWDVNVLVGQIKSLWKYSYKK